MTTYSLDAVLAPYGQCTCERNGTRCFRIPPTPRDPLCHPCRAGNEVHGYGAGPLAAAPTEPVAVYAMAVHCANCDHERGDHMAGKDCSALVNPPGEHNVVCGCGWFTPLQA